MQTGNLPPGIPKYTLAWQILDWAERYIVQPDGERAGEPWRFTDEQIRFLAWFYAVDENGKWIYRSASLRRSKGWGKSPLLAALCLIEMLGPCRFSHFDSKTGQPVGKPVAAPWIQIAATAIHQTVNTLDMIRGMLVASPLVPDYGLDVGKTIIQFKDGRPGKIEPVTAASASLEGGRPTFAVLDETHHWTESAGGHAVAKVIARNIGKNPGGLARFVESTNAYDPNQDSIAQLTHEAFQRQFEDTGKSDILYDCVEAPDGIDIKKASDEELREALQEAYGDSSWVDLDRVISEIRDPRTPAEDGYRFYLNKIVRSAESWVTKEQWESRKVNDRLRPGEQIALGFDGSIRDDSTALVACRLHDGLIVPLAVWENDGRPDWEVDVLAVDAAVAKAFSTYKVEWMYADPAYWQDIVGRWALEFGDKIVFEFWTGREAQMAKAIERFHTAIVTEFLIHDGNPTLTRHIRNVHKRESRAGYVLTKEHPKSRNKIDCAIAAILAYEARADAIADGRLKKKRRRVVGF